MDIAIEQVRSFSVERCNLNVDGDLWLRIAANVLNSKVDEVDGFPYVRAGGNVPHVGENVVAFVKRSAPTKPAFSNADYVGVSQDYASTLRTMCLRFWSDSGVLSTVENSGQRLLFPRAARSEVPWGAEFMWIDQGLTDAKSNPDETMAPDWYETALDSLSEQRREYFMASFSYAMLFTFMHELGHIKNLHYSAKKSLTKYQMELEADRSAIVAMFFAPGIKMFSKESARAIFMQMAVGVIAAFVVFHLLLIKESPATAGRQQHQGYPGLSERISQMIRLLPHRCDLFPESWFSDLVVLIRILLDVASLHPAFAYVIGTGWIGDGYSSIPIFDLR